MKKTAFALLRLAVSVSVLAVVLSRASLEALAARAANAAPAWLAAALGLALAAVLLVALRWRLLAGWLGLAIPAALAVRAMFVGAFGAQVLPSVLGTDVVRGWLVAGQASRVRPVVASVMADRLVGLFALCLLFAAANPVAEQLPPPADAWLGPLAVLGSGGALAAFVLGCGVRFRARPLLASLALALLVHAVAVVAAALVARAYGVQDALALWFSIIPLSVVASSLPVSINGWGVREATIVALAAPLGVPAAEALLVSMTLGGLNMLASLPGAVLMLRGR